MTGPPTGARIGPALAHLMAKARVIAHEHTSKRDQALREQTTTRLLEGVESHLAPHAMAMFAELRETGALPPGLEALLDQAETPGAQFDAILEFFLVMFSLIFQAGALTQPIMQRYVNEIWTKRPDIPISAPEVALSILRGFLTFDEGVEIAAMTGYNRTALQHMVDNTGEPPSPQELLLLWRRGQIDQARLDKGIRESRIRNEWIPEMHALRYAPPPAATAVAAAVQDQLSVDEAKAKLSEAGIDPENFDWLYRTHGRPPGIVESLSLVNRGHMTLEQAKQVVRESDVKNKYVDQLMELRVYLPPVRSIPHMLKTGALSKERAGELLRAHGVQDEDLPAYLNEGTALKTQAHKDVSAARVLKAVAEQYITEADARPRLLALGYDDGEITWLLGELAFEREIRLRDQAAARIRARFIAHHIDVGTAGLQLDTIRVPAAMRDDLLATWQVERDVTTAQLTLAQLARAHKAGRITDDDLRARLGQRGYSAEDVDILMVIL